MKSPSAASSSVGYLREGRVSGKAGSRVDAVGSCCNSTVCERKIADNELIEANQVVFMSSGCVSGERGSFRAEEGGAGGGRANG